MNRLIVIFIIFVIILVVCMYVFPLIKKRLMFLSSKKYLYNPIDFPNSELLYIDNLSYLLIKGSTSSTCILFSHGNGGNITYYDTFINALKKYGDVIIYDYPGYGQSLGESTEETVLESGVKMCTYILNNFPYKKIILYGFSLGGAVTVHISSVVSSPKIIGIILQGTFANMKDCIHLVGKKIPYVGEYLLKEFRSIDKIINVKYPVCVLHSKTDKVVPYSSSKILYEHIQTPKIFYELSGNHNDSLDNLSLEQIDNSIRFLETCNKFLL